MPATLHASRSEILIGLEASARSISPRQNFWKPPPVPLKATTTWRVGVLNSPAHAAVIGYTVLLPSIRASSTAGVPPRPLSPTEAAAEPATMTAATTGGASHA